MNRPGCWELVVKVVGCSRDGERGGKTREKVLEFHFSCLFSVGMEKLGNVDKDAIDSRMSRLKEKYVILSESTSRPKDALIVDDNPSVTPNANDTLIVGDNPLVKILPSDPIVQPVDINTKSTYASVAGASTKEQPNASSNLCPLVADLVFNGVNISIPRKVVEKDPWGRSSFARCLIEINSEADLVDVVTIGIPSLTGDDFTKETIRIEYEWRPPRCDECKIFGHVYDHYPKKVVSSPIVTTSNVVAPTIEKFNDGFQTVGNKKKRKGKSKSTNSGHFAGHSVKQTVRYEPKATPSAPKKGATNVSNPSKSSSMLKTAETSPKKDNFTTSNFSLL
uniref:Zinc knuckle CX2CX4HX4C n=1 Tax=Tanacetum cinerariifolium TaxID=118510 RepID=A0A6L2JH00_TANCI|nr:zinc knuckle CX2CX4HX4C [Tanacetum cinerariifolium]